MLTMHNAEYEESRDRDEQDTDARRHAEELSAAWRKAHEKRSTEIEAELMKQHTKADADEHLLLRLVAHDAALAEKLGQAEAQLAERVLAMVDNAVVSQALARTLGQVVAARDGTCRRIQDLLQTAGILRGQRKLAPKMPLRRVA